LREDDWDDARRDAWEETMLKTPHDEKRERQDAVVERVLLAGMVVMLLLMFITKCCEV
jgi:hypothetical protein